MCTGPYASSFKGKKKTFWIFEWMVHPLKRAWVEAPLMKVEDLGAAMGAAAPPLSTTPLPLSLLLLLHPSGSGLVKPCPSDSPPSPRRRAAGIFWWIFYFHCPVGSSERRLSSSLMCDRVWKRCRIAALISTILRSASVRLHHPWDLISLTLSFFEGESF